MGLLGLYLPLLCSLLLRAAPIILGSPDEQAEEKSSDIDAEISELEEKRAAELLFTVELLAQKKDYSRAADEASRIFITPPSGADDLARLKEVLQEVALGLLRAEKAPTKAAELCDKSAQTLGDDAISFAIASLAYEQLGMKAKQKQYEEKARAVRSGEQAYWFEVGSFFATTEERRMALEAFEVAAAISSDKPTHFNADSESAMASLYCRSGDYEEALRHCKNLQEIARKIVVSRAEIAMLTARVYAEKARDAETDEKYEEAVADYKKSAEFSPQPGGAYHSIGEVYLKLKKHGDAEAWFNRAAKEGLPVAHAGLGDVRKALGKLDEAEKEYAKCEKALAEVIENHPDYADSYNNLAWFYAAQGRKLDRGIELAKKAIELSPDSAEYLDTLAELFHRNGRRQEAIREIEKAIALNPPHLKYYRKQLQRFQKEDRRDHLPGNP